MYRSIVICPDQGLARGLQEALQGVSFHTVGRIVRVLDHYPDSDELTHLVRAVAPDLLFVSLESPPSAIAVVKYLEKEAEGVQTIAFHREANSTVLLEAMRAGLREFLSHPFDREQLEESLVRVAAQLEKRPPSYASTQEVFSFLPAKAGVGASTVAVNLCAQIAAAPGMLTLLADFDLNSGMLRFMMKLENPNSILDAAAYSSVLDESLWPQMVTGRGNLHMIHAGPLNPHVRIDGTQIHNLVDFARRNYKAIGFDLSGNLERYSVELMEHSKRILLVTTPEIPSLHLAREKLQFLQNIGLGGRVALILNRYPRRHVISPQEVAEVVGAPVTAVLPNDYQGVQQALARATCVSPNSDLGQAYGSLARGLLEAVPTAGVEPKKRFIEFFSLAPKSLVPARR